LEINLERSFISITPNAPNLFVLSIFFFFYSFVSTLFFSVSLSSQPSSCASKKNLFARKIYERSTSPTRPNCRYESGISFPGWSCLTFLVTFVLNRRRDPDILSASSLTCRYRYIGSTTATVDRETKSILYPDCARDSRVYIFSRLAVISLI